MPIVTIQNKSARFMNFQAITMLMVLIGAFSDHFWGARINFSLPFIVTGIVLIIAGLMLLVISLKKLGPSLTPDPIPKGNGVLVKSGIYSLSRHPIYLAILVTELGWTIAFSSVIGLFLMIPLFFVLREKAKFEESLLIEKFGAEYSLYAKKVGRFLNFKTKN